MTIHDQIDELLAADLHDELSESERHDLHNHLVECTECRQLHQETKIMNNVLEENLTTKKADPTFEQRMLAGFRNRVPHRAFNLGATIFRLMQMRSAQLTAVAALLLALVQIGKMITGEGAVSRYLAKEGVEPVVVTGSNIPTGEETGPGFDDQSQAPRAPAREDKSSSLASKGAPMPGGAISQLSKSGDAKMKQEAEVDRVGGGAATGAQAKPASAPAEADQPSPLANRKLIRNARVELEILSFEESVQKIAGFAAEEKGYIATSGSSKQANGKLRGEVVVKVLPDNLDRFLQKIRGLGELKNQTLGSEDVTKAYFDTEARVKNARVMEQRLVDMLKTKTGKVSDLLQVEKELARVRDDIEKMQGELKYWDSQVQFATATISLTEKDMEEPAAFLLKEHVQVALFAPDVEKTYNDIKALASAKVQITNAQLNRADGGQVFANVSMLIAPEESGGVINRVKELGRVQNFQMQTDRISQGGSGMSGNARTKRDSVELNIRLSREEQEQSAQQTNLLIRTSSVDAKAKELRPLAEKLNGNIQSSSFSRDPDGREIANVSLRVPMKNYAALMQSLETLGKVENVSVHRQERTDAKVDQTNAPVDVSIQVYSQGHIVSQQTGILATLRRTLAQSAGAIMWSVRMIGVAIAFLAPWAIALAAVILILRRIRRSR